MDFIRDMELIARVVLDQYGIDPSAVSGWEIVRLFLNFQLKLIKQIPRNVVMSKKIQNSSYGVSIKEALAPIEHKFRVGDDVNPHLSKGILRGEYTDALFADWRIHHLHLNTGFDKRDKRFVRRSDDVLFITISDDTAYFIDIRPHNPKREPYVFEQKALLQTIVDEYPYVLEPYKIKGAVGLEDEVNDAEQIKEMRRGVNVIHKINGAVYRPLGGGITIAGTSVMVTRRANHLYYLAKDAEKYVVKNRAQINKLLSRIENYNPSEARFHLGLVNDDFLIYEEVTRAAVAYLE